MPPTGPLATDDPATAVASHDDRVQRVDGDMAGWEKRQGLYRDLVAEFGDRRLDQFGPGDIEAARRFVSGSPLKTG